MTAPGQTKTEQKLDRLDCEVVVNPVGGGPEEPLMEPCLALQQGVFNQCGRPTFSICVCVCLPLEHEGGLLMAEEMAMLLVVVVMMMMMVVIMMVVMMMMMQWQWHCSSGFWLSSPCLLKDSLR
ncbi:uncharacterized protein ACNS7B_023522 isoform 1-T2 [Menidia menidia]